MPRHDPIRSLVALVTVLAAIVGCGGSTVPAPSAGLPSPGGSSAVPRSTQPETKTGAPAPPSWVRHLARGVEIALPPELLAAEPQESAFGEVFLQASRTTPRDPITAGGLTIGWLRPAYLRDNPGASARGIVEDWLLPLLGDLPVDRVAERDLEIDGSVAHERLLVTEPGPNGEVAAFDLLVIQRGSAQAWILYVLGGGPGAFPGHGFLPEVDAIVASIAFAPDAEPTPLAAGCPALDAVPGRPGELAFVGEYAICVADLHTGEVRAIAQPDMDPYRGPEGLAPYSWLEWSPDGGRLAFVRSTYPASAVGPLTDELIIANADGTEPRVIPGPPEATDYHGLSWSPDGRRLAASIDRSGCTGCASIWLLDVVSSTWTSLAVPDDVGYDVEAPDWSPDGQRMVAMVAPTDADYNLQPSVAVINDTGQLVTTLVEAADFSASVAWSNDGRSIAVLDSFLRDGELRTMRPDGSGSQLVTAVDGVDLVRWAFDDSALLVEREETDEPGGIWVLPLDGTPSYRLVDGTYPALIGD